MTAIQAIRITGHEERSEPKPHVVYRIEIQAPVRSWQMWRRYSEFEDLHTELTKSTGAPPPAELPPKHRFSLLRSRNNAALTEERRAGLEAYLRAIVGAKDERWRECYAFKQFLGVPAGKQAGVEGPAQYTSASWLDEHMELQARLRDVRADINKRDALADRGDPSGAHKANVEAKKKLAGIITRTSALGKGLEELGMRGMSEGELQRRTDMVARLQDDCEKLSKMVTVARMTSRGLGATAAQRNPASDADRAALLGGGGASSATSSPAGGFTRNQPVTRVFGAKPVETEETRPLDDHGVFQLQQSKMEDQDVQVSQMTTVLSRLKHLGLAINQEIREQNELLDDLTNEVDMTGSKLTAAKKQMNRLG
ncbi:syntaxin [Gloeophyllum trabeum ATCC 11539]|uniref:Syntaxin n=1 Tax=Gloeophyllum trabeum (strain ATCC 11539 / FP-39264 / Madison 617) TaxID=670483 RepID=S7QMX6_GLOTA|nr:syntaxin [Gloeophyllum trabeum ATCC 11539]EPQ60762.1 syntaxin [Gloeophyllum trabeum ATCC 11539]